MYASGAVNMQSTVRDVLWALHKLSFSQSFICCITFGRSTIHNLKIEIFQGLPAKRLYLPFDLQSRYSL